jgi:protein-S-isoprenylcysteine O-methyltransferase Ste14
MLEYEKRLHFDAHYQKLQSLTVAQRTGKLIGSVAGYVVIYAVLRYILTVVPDYQPWNNAEVWFTFCTIPFSKFDCVNFIFGLAANCYGSIRLMKITAENHNVKDDKSGAPTKLLTTGCYAKARHPMYGTFIILQSSLLLSLRSFIGIILAAIVIAFQYFNAAREEKKKLIPLFGDDYRAYTGVVRCALLKRWEILVLAAAAFWSLIGFIV